MFRRYLRAALVLAGALAFAGDALAAPIKDPVVRIRGGEGSIQIFGLPFDFDFGEFPTNPDPFNCNVGSGTEGTLLTCDFQNLTGQTIGLVDFVFDIDDTTGLVFSIEDPDNLFASEIIGPGGATFVGGGIPSGFCQGEFECFGGDFRVELEGFPDGSGISMRAAQAPEPAGLALLGLAAAAGGVGRRRRASRG